MKKIQILGPGCDRCERLYLMVKETAGGLGLECELEKVTDLQQILAFGVMMTPALVIDGQVKLVGKLPSRDEIEKLLS